MTDLPTVGSWVELAGVAVLMLGALFAGCRFGVDLLRRGGDQAYSRARTNLGRSILLGLEILIVADIIWTVAVRPTLDDLYVLVLIVFIRTFLSFALEVEISGRLPWRREER
jgi:uncharacterized membrane protein